MNFLDAAYEVLKEAQGPLHFAQIAERALAQGLLETRGETPEATMGSRLYVDTNRPNSRFSRAGKGRFTLAESKPTDDIEQRVLELNKTVRDQIRSRLAQMPADRFEALIGELLVALGFDEATIVVTRYSGDRGIDVRGDLMAGGITRIKAAVQAKKWKRNIQAPAVREVRGSLTAEEQGIIITTSDFSSGAKEEARAVGKAPISLVNGRDLIELLIRHEIGVDKRQHTVFSLDQEWWGQIGGAVPYEEPAKPAGLVVAEKVAAVGMPPGQPSPLSVTFPLAVRDGKQGSKSALLRNSKGEMTFEGQDFKSPSGAGHQATGRETNGWKYWHFQHPATGEWRPIDDLRAGPTN